MPTSGPNTPVQDLLLRDTLRILTSLQEEKHSLAPPARELPVHRLHTEAKGSRTRTPPQTRASAAWARNLPEQTTGKHGVHNHAGKTSWSGWYHTSPPINCATERNRWHSEQGKAEEQHSWAAGRKEARTLRSASAQHPPTGRLPKRSTVSWFGQAPQPRSTGEEETRGGEGEARGICGLGRREGGTHA